MLFLICFVKCYDVVMIVKDKYLLFMLIGSGKMVSGKLFDVFVIMCVSGDQYCYYVVQCDSYMLVCVYYYLNGSVCWFLVVVGDVKGKNVKVLFEDYVIEVEVCVVV